MIPITTSLYWSQALAGAGPAIDMNDPQPGYYRRRLVRGGPWVPARIWYGLPADPWTGDLLDRSPRLQCEVAGELRDPLDQWTWLAARPIAEADYWFEIEDRKWLAQHRPSDPKANPKQPINLRAAALPF